MLLIVFFSQHRDVVRTTIRATNGALNTNSQTSDSFVVDLTPPDLLYIYDGLGNADIEFQVRLSVCLCVCLSVCLFVYLDVIMSVFMSICSMSDSFKEDLNSLDNFLYVYL